MTPISDAESRVMEILWARAPQSAEAIVEALQPDTGWHAKTIKTLLNRLLRKRAVDAQRDGRRYLYVPALSRDAYLAQQSRSFLDRLFGGRVAPLLAHFSQHEKLSARDIAELRRLLDDIDRKRSR